MINNSSLNKWNRLRQKSQDSEFINRLIEGMNCSMFEAKAILNAVYDTYQPYFDNSSSMRPGQILFKAVAIENSPKEKISDCKMQSVILTLDAEEDLAIRQHLGVTGLRRHRLERASNEAFQQGGLLTVEDIANRLLNCGERTLVRDIAAFKEKNILLPLRSTIKDMGRSISHRELIIRDWLAGIEFSDIAFRRNHSVSAIALYVDKFKRVIALAKDNHEISTIAFLVKISIPLCQTYYELYRTLDIVPHRREELDDLVKKTILKP